MNHNARSRAAFLIAALATLSCLPTAPAAELTSLRCEYFADPLGIDAAKPRPELDRRVRQARRDGRPPIRCWSPPRRNCWPEIRRSLGQRPGRLGPVRSVSYAGKPLGSHMRCYWKVRVWTKHGQPTPGARPRYGPWACSTRTTGKAAGSAPGPEARPASAGRTATASASKAGRDRPRRRPRRPAAPPSDARQAARPRHGLYLRAGILRTLHQRPPCGRPPARSGLHRLHAAGALLHL